MDRSKKFHPRFYSENTNDTNATWKAIRSCIPKKSVSTRVYSNDDKTVADRFNQFFTSIGKTTKKKLNCLQMNAATLQCNQPTALNYQLHNNYLQLLKFIVLMLKGLCCHQPEIKHPELNSCHQRLCTCYHSLHYFYYYCFTYHQYFSQRLEKC